MQSEGTRRSGLRRRDLKRRQGFVRQSGGKQRGAEGQGYLRVFGVCSEERREQIDRLRRAFGFDQQFREQQSGRWRLRCGRLCCFCSRQSGLDPAEPAQKLRSVVVQGTVVGCRRAGRLQSPKGRLRLSTRETGLCEVSQNGRIAGPLRQGRFQVFTGLSPASRRHGLARRG